MAQDRDISDRIDKFREPRAHVTGASPSDASRYGGGLWLTIAGGSIAPDPDDQFGGLSGSPILNAQGMPIGIFVTSGNFSPYGPQPRLDCHLPCMAAAPLSAPGLLN
jgi:hypothetical protein